MTNHIWNASLAIVLVIGLGAVAIAQQISPEDKNEHFYKVATTLKIRESPPSRGWIFVGGPGRETGALKAGDQVTILEKRTISTVFSKTIWVKVRKRNSNDVGWIYWGTSESNSVNLKEK